MIHIADNIWFSRYLFLEQLNYQGSCSLSLYRLCLNSLHYTLVFQQRKFKLNPVRLHSLCMLPADFNWEPENVCEMRLWI